jgi:hypothetical protein
MQPITKTMYPGLSDAELTEVQEFQKSLNSEAYDQRRNLANGGERGIRAKAAAESMLNASNIHRKQP